jgi:Mor family transcriptional regulator
MAFDGDDVIEDLAVTTADLLVEDGIKRPRADDIGLRVGERIRAHWGGQNIYITRGLTFKHRERNQKIFAEFNGTNYEELAMQYGLSSMRIRQIVNRIIEQRRAEPATVRNQKRS